MEAPPLNDDHDEPKPQRLNDMAPDQRAYQVGYHAGTADELTTAVEVGDDEARETVAKRLGELDGRADVLRRILEETRQG